MAKDIRNPISASKVLVHIVDPIANLNATSFTDEPLINFFNKYYGGGVDSFVDLGFDETSSTTDLNPSTRFGQRLDHVASDFSMTFPQVTTEKTTYLGYKDAAGTPNASLSEELPDITQVSLTLSGMPFDLEKIFMSDAATSPTGWQRRNAGSRPGKFGILVAIIDNPADPTNADNISMIHFMNNVIVTDAGEISATGGENFERTINFECDATNHIMESVDSQNENSTINV